MKKNFKIIILPNKEEKCKLNDIGLYNDKLDIIKELNPIHEGHAIKQDLHIISNEEVKEGDWYINLSIISNTYSKPIIADYNLTNEFTLEPYCYHCKKIIATTDKSLLFFPKEDYNGRIKKMLPQLPESFIESYIKNYNESNLITEIQLEMIEVDGEWGDYSRPELIPKTKDNTVIIHPSKTYTRIEEKLQNQETINVIINKLNPKNP